MTNNDDFPLEKHQLINYLHREKWNCLQDYYSAVVCDFTKVVAFLTVVFIAVTLVKELQDLDLIYKIIGLVVLSGIFIYVLGRRWIQRNVFDEVYYRGVEDIIDASINNTNLTNKEMWELYNELKHKIQPLTRGEKQCRKNTREDWIDKQIKRLNKYAWGYVDEDKEFDKYFKKLGQLNKESK